MVRGRKVNAAFVPQQLILLIGGERSEGFLLDVRCDQHGAPDRNDRHDAAEVSRQRSTVVVFRKKMRGKA